MLQNKWQNNGVKMRPQKKHNNKRVTIDGIKFASNAEGRRYVELKLRQKLGDISSLVCHPKFELQPGFIKNGKTVQKITWSADFSYYFNGKRVIEDVKPWNVKRQEFVIEGTAKLRHKLFEYQNPDLTIIFVK